MKERSRAYPGIDLEEAVKRTEQLNKKLGSTGQHTREQVATGVGYAGINGRSARTIGALVHYGLLDRRKDKYALSQLAKTILFPQDADGTDRRDAIRAAAVTPVLFAELVHEYGGQELPELLGNILVARGVAPKVKEEVVSVFKASLNFAGLLDGNVIKASTNPTSGSTEDQETPDSTQNEVPVKMIAGLAPARPLPSGIVVTFPMDLDPFANLGAFIPALKELEATANALRSGIEPKSSEE